VVGEMMKRRGGNGGGSGIRLVVGGGVVVGRGFGGRGCAGLTTRLQTGLSTQVPYFKFLNKGDRTVIIVELIDLYFHGFIDRFLVSGEFCSQTLRALIFSMFFSLFLLDDGRIRIRTNNDGTGSERSKSLRIQQVRIPIHNSV
jgi:hypothetical protein